MTATSTSWARHAAGAALTAAAVAVLVACSVMRGPAGTVPAVPVFAGPSAAQSIAPGVRVVVRFGERAVPATLADTPASKELAGMLPLTVELSDAWGQAKTGPLPRPLAAAGAANTVKPVPGGIYYWPDTATLAIYYDDIGQSVPPPGLIRLGAIDTGTDKIGDFGRHVTVRIDRTTNAHP